MSECSTRPVCHTYGKRIASHRMCTFDLVCRAHRLVASMSEGIPSSTAAGGKPHAPASSEQAQEANAQREADSVSPASQQSANGGGEGKSGEMAEDSSNDGSEDGSVANSGPPDGE